MEGITTFPPPPPPSPPSKYSPENTHRYRSPNRFQRPQYPSNTLQHPASRDRPHLSRDTPYHSQQDPQQDPPPDPQHPGQMADDGFLTLKLDANLRRQIESKRSKNDKSPPMSRRHPYLSPQTTRQYGRSDLEIKRNVGYRNDDIHKDALVSQSTNQLTPTIIHKATGRRRNLPPSSSSFSSSSSPVERRVVNVKGAFPKIFIAKSCNAAKEEGRTFPNSFGNAEKFSPSSSLPGKKFENRQNPFLLPSENVEGEKSQVFWHNGLEIVE